jgi:hypothetical protein
MLPNFFINVTPGLQQIIYIIQPLLLLRRRRRKAV